MAPGHLWPHFLLLFSSLSAPITLASLKILKHIKYYHVLGSLNLLSFCLKSTFPNVHIACPFTSSDQYLSITFSMRLCLSVCLISPILNSLSWFTCLFSFWELLLKANHTFYLIFIFPLPPVIRIQVSWKRGVCSVLLIVVFQVLGK